MWNRMRRISLYALLSAIVILGMLAACAALMAQGSTAKNDQKKKDTVVGKADVMRSSWGGNKIVLMKGNVSFTHGDTVITSDQVNYDGNAKSAVSPGKIRITNPDCDIAGEKGSAYFEKKLGVVEGSVVMQLKPHKGNEPENKESIRDKFSQPTVITCQKVEYLYKKKLATASGEVVFKQDKRRASADKAIYDETKELLTLSGNVKGVDEDGQTFSAPGTVVISLKKGDEWMEAQDVNASFKIDLTEEDKSEPK